MFSKKNKLSTSTSLSDVYTEMVRYYNNMKFASEKNEDETFEEIKAKSIEKMTEDQQKQYGSNLTKQATADFSKERTFIEYAKLIRKEDPNAIGITQESLISLLESSSLTGKNIALNLLVQPNIMRILMQGNGSAEDVAKGTTFKRTFLNKAHAELDRGSIQLFEKSYFDFQENQTLGLDRLDFLEKLGELIKELNNKKEFKLTLNQLDELKELINASCEMTIDTTFNPNTKNVTIDSKFNSAKIKKLSDMNILFLKIDEKIESKKMKRLWAEVKQSAKKIEGTLTTIEEKQNQSRKKLQPTSSYRHIGYSPITQETKEQIKVEPKVRRVNSGPVDFTRQKKS